MRTIPRRRFLQLLAAGTTAALLPPVMAGPSGIRRTLILIELQGGNDGINTLVPYADPAYRRLRPNLALSSDQVIPLDHRLGLHPALEPLFPLWQAGELAIVQGVGYPRPDRSHFRSIEIWETGSGSDGHDGSGWLARALARRPRADAPELDGVVLGRGDAGPLAGSERTLVGRDLESLLRTPVRPREGGGEATSNALRHLLKVRQTLTQGSELLRRALDRATVPDGFPRDRFGNDLAQAARMIRAGVPVSCIKLSLGSFDTHRNQEGTHRRLLERLGGGLAALSSALRESDHWERTLVMTYSEFGRRAAENASRGTDHGTAAPHFLLGGAVRGGLYGSTPSLARLEQGDLVHTVDYRRLYATIERHWFGIGVGYAARGFAPLELL